MCGGLSYAQEALMSKFVEAVNANGEKQFIPAAWLEEGHRFAGQFRKTPSAKAAEAKAAATAKATTKTRSAGDDEKE